MRQQRLKELLPKERLAAIHWLRWTEVGSVFGKLKTKEVACDTPLDEAGFRNRATQDKAAVTCRDCDAIMNMRPPPR